jgi:hypothetical protein
MSSRRSCPPSPKRCRQNRWPECNNDDQPELYSEAWHTISLAVEERSAPPLGEPLVANDELARGKPLELKAGLTDEGRRLARKRR